MKKILIIITLLIFQQFTLKAQENAKDKKVCSFSEKMEQQIIDSIHKVYQIKDSLKILCQQTWSNSTTTEFVDYNKASIFHNKLKKKYNNSSFDATLFNKQINNQKKSINTKQSIVIPQRLKKKWIPLYKYKNKFYVYSDCYFQLVIEITDSIYINYYMDGPDPSIISSYSYKNSTDVVNGIIFKLYDNEKSIYLVNDGSKCNYYCPIDSINDFDIIVQLCDGMSVNIIVFDESKCD